MEVYTNLDNFSNHQTEHSNSTKDFTLINENFLDIEHCLKNQKDSNSKLKTPIKKIAEKCLNSENIENNKQMNIKFSDNLITCDSKPFTSVEMNSEYMTIDDKHYGSEIKQDNFKSDTKSRCVKTSKSQKITGNRNYTKSSIQGSISGSIQKENKGKVLFETAQEIKMYQDKINIMNNRINKLRYQENEMNRKIKKIKSCAIKDEKLKNDKVQIKSIVKNAKKEQMEKLEFKRKLIKSERQKREENIEKAKDQFLKKNQKNFELARADRLILDSMHTQFNTHVSNIKNCKYIKAKQESIENKTDKFKKQAEKEEKTKLKYDSRLEFDNMKKEQLINKLKELEKIEEECLESLKKTVHNKDQELAQLKKSGKRSNNGLSSSMIDMHNGDNPLETYPLDPKYDEGDSS